MFVLAALTEAFIRELGTDTGCTQVGNDNSHQMTAPLNKIRCSRVETFKKIYIYFHFRPQQNKRILNRSDITPKVHFKYQK